MAHTQMLSECFNHCNPKLYILLWLLECHHLCDLVQIRVFDFVTTLIKSSESSVGIYGGTIGLACSHEDTYSEKHWQGTSAHSASLPSNEVNCN